MRKQCDIRKRKIGNSTTEATPESVSRTNRAPLTLSAADGKLSRVKRRKNQKDREVSRSLIARLNRDAQQIAWRFGLSYRSIEPERANVKSRYGICYEDGVIKIRLRHAVTGRPLRYSSLVSTLCHELAHLRYFNHGVRFRVFNMELLEFAREQGIYRPGRRGSNSEDALVGEQRGRHRREPPSRVAGDETIAGRFSFHFFENDGGKWGSGVELIELFEVVGALDDLHADLVAGDCLVEDLSDQSFHRQLVELGQRVLHTRVGYAEIHRGLDLDVHRIRALSAHQSFSAIGQRSALRSRSCAMPPLSIPGPRSNRWAEREKNALTY